MRGERAPARKACENHFNLHSLSADISNWLRGSHGKKLPMLRKTCLLQKQLPLSAVKAMVIFHVRYDCGDCTVVTK